MIRQFVFSVDFPLTDGNPTMIQSRFWVLEQFLILFRFEHERRRPKCPFLVGGTAYKPTFYECFLSSTSTDVVVKEIPEEKKLLEKRQEETFLPPQKKQRKTKVVSKRKTDIAPTDYSNANSIQNKNALSKVLYKLVPQTPVQSISPVSITEFDGLVRTEDLSLTLKEFLDKSIDRQLDMLDQSIDKFWQERSQKIKLKV